MLLRHVGSKGVRAAQTLIQKVHSGPRAIFSPRISSPISSPEEGPSPVAPVAAATSPTRREAKPLEPVRRSSYSFFAPPPQEAYSAQCTSRESGSSDGGLKEQGNDAAAAVMQPPHASPQAAAEPRLGHKSAAASPSKPPAAREAKPAAQQPSQAKQVPGFQAALDMAANALWAASVGEGSGGARPPAAGSSHLHDIPLKQLPGILRNTPRSTSYGEPPAASGASTTPSPPLQDDKVDDPEVVPEEPGLSSAGGSPAKRHPAAAASVDVSDSIQEETFGSYDSTSSLDGRQAVVWAYRNGKVTATPRAGQPHAAVPQSPFASAKFSSPGRQQGRGVRLLQGLGSPLPAGRGMAWCMSIASSLNSLCNNYCMLIINANSFPAAHSLRPLLLAVIVFRRLHNIHDIMYS